MAGLVWKSGFGHAANGLTRLRSELRLPEKEAPSRLVISLQKITLIGGYHLGVSFVVGGPMFTYLPNTHPPPDADPGWKVQITAQPRGDYDMHNQNQYCI